VTFSDSFDGVAFFASDDGRSVAQKAKVSVREVPGGNVVVLNNGGRGVRRRSFTLFVQNEATYQSLLNKLGATGSLVIAEGTVTAMLEELDSGKLWAGAIQEVRATFIETGLIA
jgi:glutamate 5-kinase